MVQIRMKDGGDDNLLVMNRNAKFHLRMLLVKDKGNKGNNQGGGKTVDLTDGTTDEGPNVTEDSKIPATDNANGTPTVPTPSPGPNQATTPGSLLGTPGFASPHMGSFT